MEYSDKERGEYLLERARRLDTDEYLKRNPKLLALYKARYRDEGMALIRRGRVEKPDKDQALLDDLTRDPDKFLDIFEPSEEPDVDQYFVIYDNFDEE